MKLINLFVAALMLLGTSLAFADSQFLDSAYLKSCTSSRGEIELRKARNGDLAVKLVGLDKSRCDRLRFYDASSGRTIKSYNINGTSYTLSKSQRRALSSDCRLGIELDGNRGNEKYYITLGWWCRPSNGGGQQSSADRGISYQLSNAGNCKLMKHRQYQNRNVAKRFCQGARGKDFVSYDYSRAGNCKLMINGQYANRNVDASYCRAN